METKRTDGVDPQATTGPSKPRTKTKGEYRVGIDFNPGGHEKVNTLKRMAANVIDIVRINATDATKCAQLFREELFNSLKDVAHSEQHRCYSQAIGYTDLALKTFDIFPLEDKDCDSIETDIETAAMWAVKAATKPAQ